MQRNVCKWILIFIWLGCVGSVNAEMTVSSKTWPKQLPENENNAANYYGNSKTPSFNRAMTADGSAPLTSEDVKTVNAVLIDSDIERWYLKAGMYKATTKIYGVKNKSAKPNNTYLLWEDAKKANKDITGMQFGVGYIFEKYRIDVDYIVGTDIEYNKIPIFTAGFPDVTSKVSGQHLIATGYYEFADLFLFRPFVGASLGLGMNKAAVTFARMGALGTNGAGKAKTSIGLDYGLQVGTRVKLYNTRLFASASYRYLSLGTVKWADSSEQIKLQGSRTFNGVSLDLIYLL